MKTIHPLFARPGTRSLILGVFSLLPCFSSPVFSQDGTWQVHDFPATEVYCSALKFFDKDTGWIVGNKGEKDSVLILRTVNGGDSWRQQSPEMAGALKAVTFAQKDTGYAVGYASPSNLTIILKTENSGETWTQLVSPVTQGYLNDVHFVNPKLGWIVGRTSTPSQTRILRTTDGVNWAAQAHPGVTGELTAVHFSDALNGWAIGSGASTIPATPILLHTSNGGNTWENRNLPLDKKYLFDVFSWDANTCWIAAGSGPSGDDSVHVFKTIDGGANWTVVTLPVHSYAKQIEFLTPAEGYIAVADISDRSTTFYQTSDSGATWTPLGEKLMYRTGKMDMVRGSTIAYALVAKFVGDMQPVETKFAKFIKSQILSAILMSPFAVNMTVGDIQNFIATGKDQYGNTYPLSYPMWEANGGPFDPNGSTCTYIANRTGMYSITCTSFGSGGLVWGKANINTTDYHVQLANIVVTPANSNLVVGQNATFTATGKDQYGNTCLITSPVWTTSGGGTLTPSGTTCTYKATSEGSFTITCTQSGTEIKDTAEITTTNSSAQFAAIVVTPANANLVVGQNATFTATGKDQYGGDYPITNPVWTTSGGGTLTPGGTSCTYKATSAGAFTITCTQGGTTIQDTAEITTTNPPAQLTTIVVTPANANLVVGQNATFTATGKDQYGYTVPISSPVWTTSGGGTISPSGTTCTYTATQIGDYTLVCSQEGTAIQGTAAIHVTGTGVGIGDHMPSEFALAQNYPNPFNPVTTIEYGVKKPCRVLLEVYDIHGHEIAALVDEFRQPGRYKAGFDARHLPTGLYFYRIKMKDFSEVRKMALMK